MGEHLHRGDRDRPGGRVERAQPVSVPGACCFCPSAQSTMEDVVTGSLREELGDEIGRVILWNAISDELLDFARDFFKRKQAQSQ